MNIQDALAWANARIVDRYRMVQADFRTFQDGSVLATYDAGTRYEQMGADALSVLATEIEALRERLTLHDDCVADRDQTTLDIMAERDALKAELAEARRNLSFVEGIRLPHARKQENANGFQRGWHAALSRVSEGDTTDDLAALVPLPAAEVEIPVCAAEADLEQAFREGFAAGDTPIRNTPDRAVAAWRERRGGGK